MNALSVVAHQMKIVLHQDVPKRFGPRLLVLDPDFFDVPCFFLNHDHKLPVPGWFLQSFASTGRTCPSCRWEVPIPFIGRYFPPACGNFSTFPLQFSHSHPTSSARPTRPPVR